MSEDVKEIEFKGKRLDNGEWAHGYYYAEYLYQCIISDEERKKQEKHWIVWQENMDWGLTRMVRAQVDPATVGQYTGLKDKNGKKIYEGDIVRFSDNPIHEGTIAVCKWLDWRVGFVYKIISGDYKGKYTDMADTWRKYEVIGNIHDNPELLKEDNHA